MPTITKKVGPAAKKAAAAKHTPKVAEVVTTPKKAPAKAPAAKAPAKRVAPPTKKDVEAAPPVTKSVHKAPAGIAAKKAAKKAGATPVKKAGPARKPVKPFVADIPKVAPELSTRWAPDPKAKPIFAKVVTMFGGLLVGELVTLTGVTEVWVGRKQEVFYNVNGVHVVPADYLLSVKNEKLVVRGYGTYPVEWHYDTEHRFDELDADGKPVSGAPKHRK